MKLTKCTYLLAIGLALSFMATGCKKTPVKTTNIPNRPIGGPGIDNNTRPLDTKGGSEGLLTKSGLSTSESWDPANYNEDRAALAAHTVHFDFDSYVVKSGEEQHVQAVATALSSDTAAKLMIEGHCDERGTEEYNRALGERRALALREALAALGVDAGRIRTLSFGEDKPVAQGHDEAAYHQNRRGEFILMHPK